MRWTKEQYAEYQVRRATSGAVPQQIVCHEPVAATPRKEVNTDRFRVCVTGFRVRLLDPDNVCPKYFIDCLRYAGLIPNDRASDITLEVRQEKVKLKSDERTEIELTKIQ